MNEWNAILPQENFQLGQALPFPENQVNRIYVTYLSSDSDIYYGNRTYLVMNWHFIIPHGISDIQTHHIKIAPQYQAEEYIYLLNVKFTFV